MENLIWSRYNFLIDSPKVGKALYNSYTNGLIKLDDSLFDNLKALESQKLIDIQSIQGFSEEEISYFQDNYILVKDEETLVEIMHFQSLARIYNKKHLVLTIAPTQNCNFGCVYCYEKWRKSGSMDDKTEDAIIKYIKKQQTEYGLESISLDWYGGEPLLEYKRIKSLGQRINELGIPLVQNDIITNGYFFTEEIIKILVNLNITTVQITLDGFKDIHDQRRPLVCGKGTFDRIIENLDHYFSGKYRDSFRIALRVNIDKRNQDDYLKIYNWLKKRYHSDMLVVYPGWIHYDEKDSMKSVCFSRNEATDLRLDLYRKYQIVSENLIPDDINMECLTRSPNSMIIGWQGEIYKCFEELGDQERIVGNINDEQIWNNPGLLAKYAVGIDHYQDPKCRQCRYLPICHGGCPKRRLENKYHGYSNDCCTPFKTRLEEYIKLYLMQ